MAALRVGARVDVRVVRMVLILVVE